MIIVKWKGDEISKLSDSCQKLIIEKISKQFENVTEEREIIVDYDGENYYHAIIKSEDYKITFQSDNRHMFNNGPDHAWPLYGIEIYTQYKNKDLYRDGYIFYENNLTLSIPYSMDYCKVLNNIDRIVDLLKQV